MRYAISYVSSAASYLPKETAKNLLEKVSEYNNRKDITGLLLSSESNFFQLLEGEKEVIKELYSHIEKDPRHYNIIKFIEKEVWRPAYDGYLCVVLEESRKYSDSKLKNYLHYIEVLEPSAQKAIKRVIETILL